MQLQRTVIGYRSSAIIGPDACYVALNAAARDDISVFDMNATDKQARQGKFWRKYLRLTRAGVTVLRTLELARDEETDEEFAAVLTDLLGQVEKGAAVSVALEKAPSYFTPSVIEMVRTAEKRGAWDEVIAELSDGLLEGTFD